MKSIFDRIVSFLGLLILFPLFIVIALIIKITSKGPVLFRQKRVGQYGKLFTIYKFRSMVVNNDDTNISVLGDSRITALGKFLRKHKLDELPELWNIFRGDMSFVGPRPDVPGYADRLTGNLKRLLDYKPGITGPATLIYSNEEEMLAKTDNPKKFNDEVLYPEKVRINLEYFENSTFFSDIKIILNTVFRNIY